MPTQNIFDQLLIFVIMYQHAKNQFIPSIHSSDRSILEPGDQIDHIYFLTLPHLKLFNQLLIFVNLYQCA